ncbi:hypothetical protein CCR95_20120 [Thiocystis minor]|uniref:TorF family putative porin n=1 Tax=Thiocystis minor TaxID=61597 RepID=UPI0019128B2E|nr:TorF family putative porin [Thiocystis minor]MBK5966329.1 hypothetical protein [Thiocystis minor]
MKPQHISAALAVGALTMSAGAFQAAMAEDPHSISANIGVVSNYMWRGQTQTDNQPAVQGGLDYAHVSGFHAGAWLSNVDFLDSEGNDTNYELDVAAGFGQSINDDFSYDINAIYIAYPDGRDLDFAEIGASTTYKWLTTGIAYTVYGQADDAPGVADSEALYIQGDLYYHAALDFVLPYNLGLNLHGGYYDFRYNEGGNDYGHWGASISREAGDFGTFSFNYDQIGRDTYDEDPKLWIGWNKEF